MDFPMTCSSTCTSFLLKIDKENNNFIASFTYFKMMNFGAKQKDEKERRGESCVKIK